MRLSSFTRGQQLIDLVPEGPSVENIGRLPGSEISVKALPHTTWHDYCNGTVGPWIGHCTFATLAALGCFEGEWVLAQFGSYSRAVRLRAVDEAPEIPVDSVNCENAGASLKTHDDGVLYLRNEAVHLIGNESQRLSVYICRQSPPSFDELPPVPIAESVVLERVRRSGSSGRRSYGKQVNIISLTDLSVFCLIDGLPRS
jgi:hypothetical protein